VVTSPAMAKYESKFLIGFCDDEVSFFQPRIDHQRALERGLGFRLLALLRQDVPFADERGVMHRFQFQRAVERLQQSLIAAGEKQNIGELVPAFGKARRMFDQVLQGGDGVTVVEPQLRLFRNVEQPL